MITGHESVQGSQVGVIANSRGIVREKGNHRMRLHHYTDSARGRILHQTATDPPPISSTGL